MLAYTFYETDNRVRRYADALIRRGDQVDAMVLGRDGQPDFEVLGGVHVHRIQRRVRNESTPFSYFLKLIAFLIRSTWMLAVLSCKQRYDLIHVHSIPDFEVFATIIPRFLGARVILDIHDISPELYGSKFAINESSLIFRALVLVEQLSSAYADHVIVANHLWHKKLLKRSLTANRSTTILNYPDLEIFSPKRAKSSNSQFVICYPGTLNWHQGVDIAIEAMALLRERSASVRFVVIGDGPERARLETLIQQRNLQDHVEITGMIPIEHVAEALSQVDLGIVPKRNNSFGDEAFSTKIMEFMAMGVPVIASRTRIDQHYFGTGLLQFFHPGNAQDLADKIYELMKSPAKRETLCRNATIFIKTNSWQAKQSDYLAIVDGLVARRPSRRITGNCSVESEWMDWPRS